MKAFSITSSKVHVYSESVNMSKSFKGLGELVSRKYGKHKVDSGEMFLFYNKAGNYLKILYWNQDGYCIFAKRLPRGAFEIEDCGKVLSLVEMASLVDYAVSVKEDFKKAA